jgi:predicted metal-dependent peptidase
MNKEAYDKVIRARANLILDHPFFGSLALRLNVEEDTKVKTLCVNSKVIRYNPDFINSLRHPVIVTWVAHEVMHPALDHLGRTNGRDHKRWNYACDYAINDLLANSKSGQAEFERPSSWLYDPKYHGMTAEQIYDLLPPFNDDDDDADDDYLDIEPDDRPFDEQLQSQQDWKVALAQAANSARVAGSIPEGMERYVEESLTPKIDWAAQLQAFMQSVNNSDYSWARLNRALCAMGVYAPSLHSYGMGDLVIAMDTSISIYDLILGKFKTEVISAINMTAPERTHVIYCDAEVNHVDVFEKHSTVDIQPRGGGGTRFKPVFDYVRENNINPACLIYFTDLEGNTNFPDPGFPVLWCCVTERIAPWGTTIHLD